MQPQVLSHFTLRNVTAPIGDVLRAQGKPAGTSKHCSGVLALALWHSATDGVIVRIWGADIGLLEFKDG